MAIVKHIRAAPEIDRDEPFVLVTYGKGRRIIRHDRGATFVLTAPPEIPDDLRRLDFLATVDDAQEFADNEGIATVYVALYTLPDTILTN